MKVAAVICEFNPFHNGHSYLLGKLREEQNADFIIALMSGNFVQRGEPAVFDKFTRTRMALIGDGGPSENGSCGGYADLVLQMPSLFSSASAREFAAAGVLMALSSGIVDILGFGTEGTVSLEELQEYAESSEEAEISSRIRDNLKSGMNYPEAVSKALGASSELALSNNILAVEYLRALKKFDKEQRITPVSIKRQGDSYSSASPLDAHFCSATALRGILRREDELRMILDKLSDYVPSALLPVYEDALKEYVFTSDDFSDLLNGKLLEAKYQHLDLSTYLDVSKEIADRLIHQADSALSFTDRINAVKTRQYTYTRISRALLHIVLGTTISELDEAKKAKYISYLKILGFRKEASGLLKALKESAQVPVITKTADYKELLGKEIFYNQLYYAKHYSKNEFERSPIIL